MKGHFVKPRIQTEHMSLCFKRNGFSVGVIGELFVPKARGAVHVKRQQALLALIPLERRSDAFHLSGQGLPNALLEPNTVALL